MLASDNELFDLVKKELCVGWHFNAVQAATRQARIAQANAILEHAHIEGLGQHVASIDAFAFHDWERREPGITRDPDWLKSMLRDNPECRVQSKSPNTTVSFAGLEKPETGNRKPECKVEAASPPLNHRSTPLHSGLRSQASALSSALSAAS
jgi:hypothetical protein